MYTTPARRPNLRHAVLANADSGHEDTLRRITIEIGPTPGQYRYRAQRTR